MEISSRMEKVMFRSCLVCFYHWPFFVETDMNTPLWFADIYLLNDWLDMEEFSDFVVLFSSEGNPINDTYKLRRVLRGKNICSRIWTPSKKIAAVEYGVVWRSPVLIYLLNASRHSSLRITRCNAARDDNLYNLLISDFLVGACDRNVN